MTEEQKWQCMTSLDLHGYKELIKGLLEKDMGNDAFKEVREGKIARRRSHVIGYEYNNKNISATFWANNYDHSRLTYRKEDDVCSFEELFDRVNENHCTSSPDISTFAKEELRPCPFCGGQGTIKTVQVSTGLNHTGKLPVGAVITRRGKSPTGKPVYEWEKMGYSPICLNENCLLRTIQKKYPTRYDAITAWNNRIWGM